MFTRLKCVVMRLCTHISCIQCTSQAFQISKYTYTWSQVLSPAINTHQHLLKGYSNHAKVSCVHKRTFIICLTPVSQTCTYIHTHTGASAGCNCIHTHMHTHIHTLVGALTGYKCTRTHLQTHIETKEEYDNHTKVS